jgi:hypothetical protein
VIPALSRLDGESFLPGFLYSPFTAADEKIPLSIGQVNCKPQYLVFSSHFQHQSAKHSQLPCGKHDLPCRKRPFGVQNAPNPVQMRLSPRFPSTFQAYAPYTTPTRRRIGANTAWICANCGETGPIPGPLELQENPLRRDALFNPCSAVPPGCAPISIAALQRAQENGPAAFATGPFRITAKFC